MDALHDICPVNDALNLPEWNTVIISGGGQTLHPSPSTGSLKPALSLCHTPMDCIQGQPCQCSYSCPDSKLQTRHSHIPRQPIFNDYKKYLRWNSVRQIADTVKPNGMSLSGRSRSAWMVSNHSPAVMMLLCMQGEDTQQWHSHWGSCHSPVQPELEWHTEKREKDSSHRFTLDTPNWIPAFIKRSLLFHMLWLRGLQGCLSATLLQQVVPLTSAGLLPEQSCKPVCKLKFKESI